MLKGIWKFRILKWTVVLVVALILLLVWLLHSGGNSNPPPIVVSMTRSNMPLRVFPGVTGVFFILPDGSLWRWGQPGGPHFSRAAVPQQVGTNCDWAQAFAANNHCVGLRTNGTLWEWGWRGNGNAVARDPVQVDPGQDWVDIAAGDVHAAALRRDGTVWAWGDNSMKQLGATTPLSETNLVQVGTNHDWIDINCGQGSYTWGLRRDGTLWVWGQIQGMVSASYSSPIKMCRETNWVRFGLFDTVENRAGETWAVSAVPDPDSSVVANGSLYARNLAASPIAFAPDGWLSGAAYQISRDGTLRKAKLKLSPTHSILVSDKWKKVGNRTDWVSLWGGGTVIALTADGTVWTWGVNFGSEPILDNASKIVVLKAKVLGFFGVKTARISTSARMSTQKQPRPLMKIVTAQPSDRALVPE